MLQRGRVRHRTNWSIAHPNSVVNSPGEFTNLAGDPAAAGVQEYMTAVLLRRWDLRRIDREVRASQRRRQLVREAAATGAGTRLSLPPTASIARGGMPIRAAVGAYVALA